jgi:hypothetical protein
LKPKVSEGEIPFIIDKNVDETTMLGPQLEILIMIVPSALTSTGKKLVGLLGHTAKASSIESHKPNHGS